MRALGLLGCTLAVMAVAGCGKSATQKATDDLERSVETTAQLQRTVDLERKKVAADKAVVALDADALLGQENAVLEGDTLTVITDLYGMPAAFRSLQLSRILGSTASAGCVVCTHLIEGAM